MMVSASPSTTRTVPLAQLLGRPDFTGGDTLIGGLQLDSRKVKGRDLFLAELAAGATVEVSAKVSAKNDDSTAVVTLTVKCQDVTVLGKAQAVVRHPNLQPLRIHPPARAHAAPRCAPPRRCPHNRAPRSWH